MILEPYEWEILADITKEYMLKECKRRDALLAKSSRVNEPESRFKGRMLTLKRIKEVCEANSKESN